ncbi:hypothetical protein LTR70_003855 [Exophiala xenobiotica]|uniref:Glutaredoxin-like protein n=1 Tax=Lithohypha guttulata TaxID=1690604 RepID=A0ABR0KFA7_9EURO|nr:hypothetical protein LTR24_003456 [Lithohypha guttulata]KAK5322174.1 hypothetical protein LTR70_003855 [Exophiala xenobiotica]
MRPSVILRMYSSRLTLFTKAECGLCDTAKARLAQVQKRRTVEYKEVDIMNKDNHKWFNMVMHTYSKPDIVCEEKKLMHRFTEEDVEALIDEAEQQVQAG